jgi:hypothetical protein
MERRPPKRFAQAMPLAPTAPSPPGQLSAATLLSIFGEQPIQFHRSYLTITHSVTAALLLSVLLAELHERVTQGQHTEETEIWFALSSEHLIAQTGLSRTELQSAKRRLYELDILHTRKRGMPPVTELSINEPWLSELIDHYASLKYPQLARNTEAC